MAAGVLLDPVTGRPSSEERLRLPGLEAILELADPSIRDNLRRAADPRGPRASRQYFRELLEPVQLADSPSGAAISSATETAMYTVASTDAAIAANTVKTGQIWKVTAAGVLSSPGTPGTVTITPRWGTSTSGTSLTASPATTGVASITNGPWIAQMWLIFRTVGATGTVVCVGTFESPTVTRDIVFGGPSTTVDTTVAAGLFLGITISVASWTFSTRAVFTEALN